MGRRFLGFLHAMNTSLPKAAGLACRKLTVLEKFTRQALVGTVTTRWPIVRAYFGSTTVISIEANQAAMSLMSSSLSDLLIRVMRRSSRMPSR